MNSLEIAFPLNAGDRVRHSRKPEWGIGQVLACGNPSELEVLFEDIGYKRFERAAIGRFIRVIGDEASSDYLTALVRGYEQRLKASAASASKKVAPKRVNAFQSFKKSVELFLSFFPQGFEDPDYLEGPRSERSYKLQAVDLAKDLLGREQLGTFIQQGEFSTVCSRAKSVMNKINLIHTYEKVWLGNALREPSAQQRFAHALFYSLYSDADLESRFTLFASTLVELECAKWTLATYFLFLLDSASCVFVKPEVTKNAAEILGFEINYKPEPNWLSYSLILQMAALLRGRLLECGNPQMKPRDMIDVQSFIWVVAPSYSS